ncbi:MAG TPA: SUMF1/EgtB/PvdO family nonheme iron enzyme [Labilithrix sp.]
MGRRFALVVGCALIACGGTKDDSAGEVLVVVDTDAPVPSLVSRLRIDLYREDGTWYATHDVERARPSDWPTSFGVYADDAEHVALVRLRAYAEGRVRDYRGERFEPRPTTDMPLDPSPAAPETNQPRLIDDGVDFTPTAEPEPHLAIDRLLRIRTTPGVRGAVRVVMRGACIGTMADVANASSCVDVEDVRVVAAEETVLDDTSLPPTLAGTFGAPEPCTATPRAASAGLFDDEVCVDGATFVLGTDDWVFFVWGDSPERVATLAPFRMDRFEVTVGRWRSAIAAGFASPDATPTPNEGDIPTLATPFTDPSLCTWSATPRGRESHAINCISQAAARAFCRFEGGDLPSEAQWEYVAAVAARPYRTRFAWGGPDDYVPTCDDAVFGRGEATQGQPCVPLGYGPQPVDARIHDASVGLGVVGLAGGVAERARDAIAALDARCWEASGLNEPGCDVEGAPHHSVRGASWHDNLLPLRASARRSDENRGATDATSDVGFRCVRRGTP